MTFALNAIAEQFEKTEDGYEIHYNAFNSNFLNPEVAKVYGITRSKNRALLNISVLKEINATKKIAVTAEITVEVVNLNEQSRNLNLREIVEGSEDSPAIYYIDDFKIYNGETLNFTITVDLEKEDNVHDFRFSQQFFVD